MPSLIETSVVTFRFACVTAYTALVLTALACYIYHMILFIFLICNVHGCNSTQFSWSTEIRSRKSFRKKETKKKKPLFWASVINSLFCGRINMHIYCSYIVHFGILVFHFIVIAVFASMREISFLDRFKVTTYTCLKRSHLTRTTCGGWPGNSSGNLGEYLYRCHR